MRYCFTPLPSHKKGENNKRQKKMTTKTPSYRIKNNHLYPKPSSLLAINNNGTRKHPTRNPGEEGHMREEITPIWSNRKALVIEQRRKVGKRSQVAIKIKI